MTFCTKVVFFVVRSFWQMPHSLFSKISRTLLSHNRTRRFDNHSSPLLFLIRFSTSLLMVLSAEQLVTTSDTYSLYITVKFGRDNNCRTHLYDFTKPLNINWSSILLSSLSSLSSSSLLISSWTGSLQMSNIWIFLEILYTVESRLIAINRPAEGRITWIGG